MRLLTLVAVSSLVVAPLGAQDNVGQAVQSITAADFLHRVGIIAHDSMRGRDTPSPELDQTAEYVAAEFGRMGLTPGGDNGTFIQRYPLRRTVFDLTASGLTVWGGRTLRFGEDVARLRGNATTGDGVSGPTVVVTGRGEPAALARLSLEGAVALVLTDAPRNFGLIRSLTARNPAAVIFVTRPSEREWGTLMGNQAATTLGKGWGPLPSGQTPVLEVREASIAEALRANGFDPATAERGGRLRTTSMSGLNFSVTLSFQTAEALSAPNVIGILEGSDPALRAEYVAFSGHMDHVGVRRPVNGDSIFNGADDDASGTIAVVEAAEAFAMLQPRPRRSLAFVLVSGEEKGLWGSEYFSEEPTVSMDRIVANLNADMVGRNWPDTIVAIGMEHSDLGETLNRVNAAHPEIGMTAIDDLWPEQRYYFRADHFNFARKGVPILFFFNGTHDDYHRPSDEVDKIDGEKASRIVKLLFYLGLEVANADDRPVWYPASYREIVGN
jgi:hypothetical protein